MLPTTNDAAYAAVSYVGCAHHDTHPMYIRPIATLLGLDPAPPSRCRVLEIGCAEGRNIIPMAAGLPDSRFVGLDLSERHIEVARESSEALGLGNLEFVVADIERAGDDLGTFDYIIAHGVYSWIPEAARQRLLSLCHALLAPQGVAYVSHNVFPGWHRREALRRMMRFHIRDVEPVSEHAGASRELVEFLSASAPASDPAYGAWLQEEVELLSGSDDFYVFHEHLAVHNDPSYFHEFMDEADRHGLQFVADAFLPANFGKMLPSAVAEQVLRHSGRERLSFEQYYDFVLNRTFRKTLLCKKEARVAMPPRLASWADAHALCPYEPALDVEAEPGCTAWRKGALLATDINPPTAALLALLAARWPCSMTVPDLFAAYRALAADGAAADTTLDSFCAQLFVPAVLELIQIVAIPVVSGVRAGPPAVTRAVRHQLESGVEPLTTVHHNSATLTPPVRTLAQLADGSRDVAQLAEALPPWWPNDAPDEDRTVESARPPLAERVVRGVTYLRYLGLLE